MGKTTTPRGIRNNNPLNIVHSKTAWMGRSEQQNDPKFVQFGTMQFGVRAAMVLLRTYINKYKLQTIEDIINRWCPDDTAESYISNVTKKTGLKRHQQLSFDDKDNIIKLTEAMAEVECGVFVWEGSVYGLTPTMFERAYLSI